MRLLPVRAAATRAVARTKRQSSNLCAVDRRGQSVFGGNRQEIFAREFCHKACGCSVPLRNQAAIGRQASSWRSWRTVKAALATRPCHSHHPVRTLSGDVCISTVNAKKSTLTAFGMWHIFPPIVGQPSAAGQRCRRSAADPDRKPGVATWRVRTWSVPFEACLCGPRGGPPAWRLAERFVRLVAACGHGAQGRAAADRPIAPGNR